MVVDEFIHIERCYGREEGDEENPDGEPGRNAKDLLRNRAVGDFNSGCTLF